MAKLKSNLLVSGSFKIMLVGICLIISFFSGWAGANAENPKILSLEEIVVTASRSERKIQDIPAHATVITRDKIESRNILTLDEALRYQSGLSSVMVRDMAGSSRQISLRGFRGQGKTQILLNGHPLNGGYNGQVDWSSLPISNIERLKIVKGPYSALYGGAAMGGTIQIITRDSKKPSAYLKGLLGEDQTKGWRFHFGTGLRDRVSLSLGFDHTKTDGYIDQYVVIKKGKKEKNSVPILVTGWTPILTPKGENAYLVGDKGEHWAEHQGFTTQFSFDFSPSMTMDLFFMNQYSKNGFGTSHSTLVDPNGDEARSGTIQQDKVKTSVMESDFLNGEMEKAKNTYHGSFIHRLNPESSYKFMIGYTDEYRNKQRLPSKTSTSNEGAGTLAQTPSTSLHIEGERQFMWGTKHELTFGVGYFGNEIEDDEWTITNWLDEDTKSQRTGRTVGEDKTVFGFIQDEYYIRQDLNLLAGLRYDHWQSKGLVYENQQITSFDKQKKDNYSPRLGLSYHPLPETQIRAAVGTAFRSPPIQALYRTTISTKKTTLRNPYLEPEKTFSWEVGIDQQFNDNIGLRLTYFENRIRDMIYSHETDPKTKTWERENAGKGSTKGIETELEYRLTSWLTWWGNWTYQEAKIKENSAVPESEGKRIPLVPWAMTNIGFDLDIAHFHTSLVGQYKGKVYKEDDNSDYVTDVPGSYDSYFILNAKISYAIDKHLKFALAVDNIYDRTYYEYNKAPGRRIFGEISYIY